MTRAAEMLLAVLDDAIARGLADAKAGRFKPAEDVLQRLERKYKVQGAKRN